MMTPIELDAPLRYADRFFAVARERYRIRQRRLAGDPPPWTNDSIFQQWRFCNVHREHDRTTEWFRDNVRNHLDGLAVVEAIVIFRYFNLISTGERVKDLLLEGWDSGEARRRLTGVSPIVTGAYQIKTVNGLSKLEGQLQAIDLARPRLESLYGDWGQSLQRAWRDLKAIRYLGPFLAYEIVSDLRWTPVLREATDVTTWANAGPGCARGLSIVQGRDRPWDETSDNDQMEMRRVMRFLLASSRQDEYWPQDWQAWEMREVEHVACEFAKYERAAAGNPLKRRFHFASV